MMAGMRPPLWDFRSVIPGALWPAVPEPAGAVALSLLFQLERSQWLPAARLIELQRRQLEALLRHCFATVPYYRALWGAAPDAAGFAQLPILMRRDLQDNFESLTSERLPAGHGPVGETRTSGSTGSPVRVLKTQVSNLYWSVLTLRDHLWHRRDLSGKLAVIRQGATPGEATSWGPATQGLVATGPTVMLSPASSVDEQLEWLVRQRPAYLFTYPSLVADLARASLARDITLPQLREVRTFGELLAPEVRDLCREAWEVPVIDVYSGEEAGYIALQCPNGQHYHVQSESVLAEVLDEQGRPCLPGETGRIVVTDLHNFATPLVRYDVGDFGEFGAPCSCGRGLPVLQRIVGRARNMLVTAGGKRYWPGLGSRTIAELAPVRQYQLVQKEFDLIEVRIVPHAPFTDAQEDSVRRLLLSRLPAGLRLKFVYCQAIARSAGGKFEDFLCEIVVR